MSYFSPGALRDHWFRIGRLEVGSTMLVVLAVAASWVAWVVAGGGAWIQLTALWPQAVLDGQVWRLVTWPLANALGLWPLLGLFFFWYFGTDLEQQVGKDRMLRLLMGIWFSLTALTMLLGVLLPFGSQALAGISQVQFVLLLLWIAEYPNRPFFFNIPAWVVGAVLVGLNVLQMLAYRDVVGLLALLGSFVLVAFVARRVGLLSSYDWIPGRANRPQKRRQDRVAKEQAKRAQQRAADDAKLDALLDQISAKGMDSLSASQRRELMRLRNRR
ncbi:rhomboid family intramembrane serine protease [Luteococcus peritonei]|uniref:Rhomboid family intramembrane serine protease n=1 Tax=Luteococcus peritonei TaxID=88874 RepID=A0ABW4RWA4_9ACTN